MRNNPLVIPAADRPEVILRFGEAKSLLLSGCSTRAAASPNTPSSSTRISATATSCSSATSPIYRGETVGTYPLVYNAILNFNHLKQ